jgi:hypothetical protein
MKALKLLDSQTRRLLQKPSQVYEKLFEHALNPRQSRLLQITREGYLMLNQRNRICLKPLDGPLVE